MSTVSSDITGTVCAPAHGSERLASHFARLPSEQLEFAQFSRGAGLSRSFRAWGKDMIFIHMRVVPHVVVSNATDPDWVGVMLPLKWRNDLLINGWQAMPDHAFFVRHADGYYINGQDREVLTIAIRKSRLLRACAALLGRTAEEIWLPTGAVSLDALGGRSLIAEIRRALSVSCQRSGIADGRLAPGIEEDLICRIAGAFANLLGSHMAPSHVSTDAVKVVRAAERVDHQFWDRAPRIVDLCTAAGVRHTRLAECFAEVVGVPPKHYLIQRRLTRVRDWLLDTRNPPRSVKDAAFAHGFTNGGRFAARYRHLFGEAPSETLSRSFASHSVGHWRIKRARRQDCVGSVPRSLIDVIEKLRTSAVLTLSDLNAPHGSLGSCGATCVKTPNLPDT